MTKTQHRFAWAAGVLVLALPWILASRPASFGISYGHSGFFPGYVTEMMYFPEYKFAVAVQVNSSVRQATGKPLAAFVADFAEIIVKAPVNPSMP